MLARLSANGDVKASSRQTALPSNRPPVAPSQARLGRAALKGGAEKSSAQVTDGRRVRGNTSPDRTGSVASRPYYY